MQPLERLGEAVHTLEIGVVSQHYWCNIPGEKKAMGITAAALGGISGWLLASFPPGSSAWEIGMSMMWAVSDLGIMIGMCEN